MMLALLADATNGLGWHGHRTLSDVLFLLAAIAFAIAAVLGTAVILDRPSAPYGWRRGYSAVNFIGLGLCLLAISLLIA